MIEVARALALLRRWAVFARRDFAVIPGRTEWGVYGTGYNNWGVQTQQKFLAAMAVVAEHPMAAGAGAGGIPAAERTAARTCALQALRLNLATHVSGAARLPDGQQWGHTWISALGIERMMFGVAALEPHLTNTDRSDISRVLASEADWIARRHVRGKTSGVVAGRWGHEGRNAPESNLWNGALLWRTAERLPTHTDAATWREEAHRFLLNGVSLAADGQDETVIAGKRVRDWTAGDNYFPNLALDHHSYLNIGYMAICVSNAALLHFDLKQARQQRPESLDHHQADLWRVLRTMVFDDGRLARIGGDSRVRYCYCQDYLLPALLYAADRLGDAEAVDLAAAQLKLIDQEADYSEDGGFFSRRLAPLRAQSNYYYCRLESDRACALAMAAWHAERVAAPAVEHSHFVARAEPVLWLEPEHGAAMHRSPTRLAAFAWRAHGLTQGMCLPPQDGSPAEWEQNLAGRIEFQAERATRVLESQAVAPFEGGFLTSGSVIEGAEATLAEGWKGGPLARHRLVFCALPDDHTVVGLQLCVALDQRVFPRFIGGMQFHLANDLYNRFRRWVDIGMEPLALEAPAQEPELRELNRWVCIGNKIGLCGLYGGRRIAVERSPARRGGTFASLYVESFYWGAEATPTPRWPGETLLDCGWTAVSTVTTRQMAEFARANADGEPAAQAQDRATERGGVRAVIVVGLDGQRYGIQAALGAAPLPTAVAGTVLAETDRARLTRL